MESILIQELVGEICKYLETQDIINFHLAYNIPMSAKLLLIFNNELNKIEYKFKLIKKVVKNHNCEPSCGGYDDDILRESIKLIIKSKDPKRINWDYFNNNWWKYDFK